MTTENEITDLADVLIVDKDKNDNENNLKQTLVDNKLLMNKCYSCDIGPVYNNKPLILELIYINGKNYDNRIENLTILCPNCCSQNYKSIDKYQSVSINSIKITCKELVDKIKSTNTDFDSKKYTNQVNKLTTKFTLVEILQELQNIIISNGIPEAPLAREQSSPQEVKKEKNERKLTKKCSDCDKLVHNRSERCIDCHAKYQAIVKDRPSYEQLIKDVNETNYTATGKKYNVSDTTIRKWIKKYEKDNTPEAP